MGSPLTAVLARLDTVKLAQAELSQDAREDLDATISSVLALTRMTHDLLDVSRLEAGRMPIRRSNCDVTRLANEVWADLGASDSGRGLEVDTPGPVEISCDESVVRRVIENLVSNGIKHAGRQPVALAIKRVPGVYAWKCTTRARRGARIPGEDLREIRHLEARQRRNYHSVGLGWLSASLPSKRMVAPLVSMRDVRRAAPSGSNCRGELAKSVWCASGA